jgi:hypothetical protein
MCDETRRDDAARRVRSGVRQRREDAGKEAHQNISICPLKNDRLQGRSFLVEMG